MTARPSDLTIDGVAQQFRDARGLAEDETWARTAAGRLMLDGVREDLATTALADELPVLCDAREPATELFGDPRQWAAEQQADWRVVGIDVRRPAPSPSELARDIGVAAAVCSVLFGLVIGVGDGWTLPLDLSRTLFPLLLGAGVVGQTLVWETLSRRYAFRRAVVLAAGALLLYSAGVAASVFATADIGRTETTALWFAPIGAGYWTLGRLVARVLSTRPTGASPVEDLSNREWEQRLTQALRARLDLPERQVREIVRDAADHATDSGRTPADEFGEPESYASSFAPDHLVRRRREAWFWTGLLILPIVLALSEVVEQDGDLTGAGLGTALWALCCALIAALAWRDVARARRERSGRSSGDRRWVQ